MHNQQILFRQFVKGKRNLLYLCVILTIFVIGTAVIFRAPKRGKRYTPPPAWLSPLNESSSLLPLMGKSSDGTPAATIEDIEDLLANLRINNRDTHKKSVVICMQDLDNDWSRAQIRAMRKVFDNYGIRVATITDAEFNIAKQLYDYRHAAMLSPDLIITLPIDAQKTANKLRKVAAKGTRFVFIDSIPEGFKHPADYASMVVADSYANGYYALRILADSIKGNGKLALLHWNTTMLTTDMRSKAAKKALQKYPDIEAIHVAFDSVADVAGLTAGLLEAHPDLAGIWTVWDSPALEAVKVIREQKRNIYVTTVDLGRDAAMELASGDILIGLTAQHPMHQGYAQALCAIADLNGIVLPKTVIVPGQIVTRERLPKAWRLIYSEPLPSDIASLLSQKDILQK